MENIIDMLSDHTLEITFISLSSGREISAHATLKGRNLSTESLL